MNTTEKIVESYFRIRRNCFTISDVKVHGGNNRQLDLIAYQIEKDLQYHVEIGVTHVRGFQPSADRLEKKIQRKFFGEPREQEKPTKPTKLGRNYFPAIQNTYRRVGFTLGKVERIWVCWQLPKSSELGSNIKKYCEERGIHDCEIQFLSFRDEVIPELLSEVGTANYGDDALRTLSLLRQCDKQGRAARERKKQSRIQGE